MRTLVAGVWAALGVSVAVGCAGRVADPTTGSRVVADPCLVIPPPAVPLDTVTVVVEERGYPSDSILRELSRNVLDARAVTPAFALAQVYEPLVRVTCDGRFVPAVATSWFGDASGRSWSFHLRGNARFSDGTPVTAQAVVGDWTHRHLDRLAIESFRMVWSMTVDGDSVVNVSARDSQPGGPMLFGHPLFSVGGRDSSGAWTPGTGPYVPDALASTSERTVLRPAGLGSLPTLIVRARGVADERDLLDAGVDILETRDPTVIDYARRIENYGVYPLPWDRTYALVITPSAERLTRAVSDTMSPADADEFRVALARDAVRADGRPAAAPTWWSADLSCLLYPPMFSRSFSVERGERRIAYPDGDPVARALAERIVAIARDTRASAPARRALTSLAPELMGDGSVPFAAPVERLGSGNSVPPAYVLPLPRQTTSRCWSQSEFRLTHGWRFPERPIPLIDTRSYLIARRGAPAVSVDWEGRLRIHPSPR